MSAKLHIPRASRDDYETPAHLFDFLDERFGQFDMDPACTLDQYSALTILARGGSVIVPPDHKTHLALRPDVLQRIFLDGLTTPWFGAAGRAGKVWLNPPYGRALGQWVPKAVAEVECGNAELVCALLPARTGPRWWQENILSNVRWTEGHAVGTVWDGPGWSASAHPLLHELIFLPGRETFVGAPGPANFDLAAVVWKQR